MVILSNHLRRSKMESHPEEILSDITRLFKAHSERSAAEFDSFERTCARCSRGDCTKHGFYPRSLPRSGETESAGTVLIQRYLCKLCERTYSRPPPDFLPRFRVTLQAILQIAACLITWKSLSCRWGLWRSTIQRWKGIGKTLLAHLPEFLGIPGLTWSALQSRFSHWLGQENRQPGRPTQDA